MPATSPPKAGQAAGPAAPGIVIPVTNGLERANKEIKRRTDVVGVFANPPALLRLTGAVLAEIHDEWQVSDRRIFSEASMAKLQDSLPGAPATDQAPAVAIPAAVAS